MRASQSQWVLNRVNPKRNVGLGMELGGECLPNKPKVLGPTSPAPLEKKHLQKGKYQKITQVCPVIPQLPAPDPPPPAVAAFS